MRILIYSLQKSHSLAAAARFSLKENPKCSYEIASRDDIDALIDCDPRDNVAIYVVDENPLNLIQDLRTSGIQTLAICASEATSEEVVKLLDGGYDDVIGSQIPLNEVLARLRAIRRRTLANISNETRCGSLTIFIDGRDPEVDNSPIKLTKIEYTILECLSRRIGGIVSREVLFEQVWPDSEKQPYDKVLDVHIFNLRKKLSDRSGGHKFIETLPQRGYRLIPDMTPMPAILG